MIQIIIAFIIGGTIGIICGGLLGNGKRADLYTEIEYWKKRSK